MKPDERTELVTKLQEERLKVLFAKGKAYAQDEDTNYNFKIIAQLLGLTPFQVWAVYWLKPIICVTNAIQLNPERPIDNTEGMEGRIIDIENYSDILYTLLKEL